MTPDKRIGPAGNRADSRSHGGATDAIVPAPSDIAKLLRRKTRLAIACDLFGLLVLVIALVRAVAG